MVLRKGDFADFAGRAAATGKSVIVYGAGVIGQVAAPYWLCRYQLEDSVLCYVDADARKQGQTVRLGSREVPIRPLAALNEACGRYILLVTPSAFEPVIRTLEQIPGTKEAEVYFLPVMLLDNAHAPKGAGVVKTGGTPLIPKKIHYCWFSGNPIPGELQKCMDSWRRFCPDYEIVRWDEGNYDIHKNRYMEQAYAHKKWSFVTDFARLDILYQHGGIYLDTDVELLRNWDELLYQPAFCGVEKWGTVNSGCGIGAQAGSPAIRAMLAFRADVPFLQEDGSLNQTACGYYETPPLMAEGLRPDGTTQVIAGGGMTVYASDFFAPFDYTSGETKITGNTFSIHHYSGTWLGEHAAAERGRTRAQYQKFVESLTEEDGKDS